MHPYKLLVRHQFTEQDLSNATTDSVFCNRIFLVMRLILICLGVLTTKIFVIGLILILKDCMNVYYTALKLLTSVQS